MVSGRHGGRAIGRTLLVLHLGGLGDLVLVSECIARLRDAEPESRIVMAVRARFAHVPPLYEVPPDAVVPVDLDVYGVALPTDELAQQALLAARALADGPVDVLVSPEVQATWFSFFAAAVLRPRETRFTSRLRTPAFLVDLAGRAGIVPVHVRVIAEALDAHALERIRAVAPSTLVRTPRINVPEAVHEASRAWRTARDLEDASYLICFPGGTLETPEKFWPPRAFVEALAHFAAQTAAPIVLSGEERERSRLDEIAEAVRSRGGAAHVHSGNPADVALLVGLVASARAYFGNDTGPVHLAAALGRPGVTVYGGGTWPLYAPWGGGSIGLVHPLPCFGCGWDCTFGRGHCVESLGVDDVSPALLEAWTDPPASPLVRRFANRSAAELAIIGEASSRYRDAQRDRAARFDVILRLRRRSRRRRAQLAAVAEGAEALIRDLEGTPGGER